MSKKEKKQQSLLNFPSLRKHSSAFSSNSEEVIVIEDDIIANENTTILKGDDFIDESVLCPICSLDLAPYAMDLRTRHVEQCLTTPTCLETPESNTPIRFASDKKTKTEKKPLGQVQVQRAKYVNSVDSSKRRKVTKEEDSETSRELLPSSKKNVIPELKILRFFASPNQEYCVSVDAFNFKPHELISQYFLSHFHSDHYGGITKRWSRERTIDSKIIYCSSITGRLLTIRFNIDPIFIFNMENDTRYKVYCYKEGFLENGGFESNETVPGLYVTPIDANHCPGAVIFLYESIPLNGDLTFYLHCGDFRINKDMINHPLLQQFHLGGAKKLAKVYLDTTYMNPSYNFPKQEQVCDSISQLVKDITEGKEMVKESFGKSLQSRITQFLPIRGKSEPKKCLVLVGTYLIGKERIAMSILKKLGQCPIYVSNINSRGDKAEIVRAFQDPYLDSVLTHDPLGLTDHQVVVHLVPMKIVGTLKELTNYFNFNKYHDTFERCVGLRPTGWTFQDNDSSLNAEKDDLMTEERKGDFSCPARSVVDLIKRVQEYSSVDILKQNPFTAKKYAKFDPSTFRIFSLPYSEHLSFRELCFFVVFLNIGQVIPTVNTHNPESSSRMAKTIGEWEALRRKLVSNLKIEDSCLGSPMVSLADF